MLSNIIINHLLKILILNDLIKDRWDSVMHQLERAYGRNMTDIITIFTFQAASIPFLKTVFKDYLASLRHLPKEIREAVLYLSIAAFSSVADNYVACKLGLELLPEKPEIPLIAAIIGGSTLPTGNMANYALVSSKEHSLKDGLKELKRHADTLGFGFAYAEAIPYIEKVPIVGRLYSKTGILQKLGNH